MQATRRRRHKKSYRRSDVRRVVPVAATTVRVSRRRMYIVRSAGKGVRLPPTAAPLFFLCPSCRRLTHTRYYIIYYYITIICRRKPTAPLYYADILLLYIIYDPLSIRVETLHAKRIIRTIICYCSACHPRFRDKSKQININATIDHI